MKKKPSHAELDAILAKTRSEFEAIIATVDVTLPSLLEEFDVAAMTRDLGLDEPINAADIADMLTKPSAPARPPALTAPPAAHAIPTTGTVKISVRIPARILAAFRARADERRQPYQKLLNQALRDAVRGWEAPVVPTSHV